MSTNPFSTNAPQTPAAPAANTVPATPAPATPAAPAAPAAPAQVAQPVAPEAAAPQMDDEGKKKRKTPNRQMTADERKYVIQNYSTKTTSEMAIEMGLTRQQVYGTVRKSREVIQSRIDDAVKAGDTETANKLQAFIDQNLPEKPFGGGAGAGRGSSIDSAVDSLIAGL